MALGVPGTDVRPWVISRPVDWSPGSSGFPELTKRMQHVVLRLVRTRIEGCFQTGSSMNLTRQKKPNTLTA